MFMHLIAKEWLTVKKGRISAEVAFIQYGRCQSASMANTCGVWRLAGRRWQRQMRRYEELLYVETPLRFFFFAPSIYSIWMGSETRTAIFFQKSKLFLSNEEWNDVLWALDKPTKSRFKSSKDIFYISIFYRFGLNWLSINMQTAQFVETFGTCLVGVDSSKKQQINTNYYNRIDMFGYFLLLCRRNETIRNEMG